MEEKDAGIGRGTPSAGVRLGVGIAKIIGALLALYVLVIAIYAIVQYGSTKSKLLTYGVSDATGSLVAWAILLIAIGVPALAIFRVVTLRGRPIDYAAAMVLPLISWGIAQMPANFDAQSAAALKYCAPRPDGSLFCLDHPGFDPVTQKKLVAISQDVAEIEFRKRKGLIPRRITQPISDIVFFDSLTAQPKVWVAKNDLGCFDLFDNPGVDPQTGEQLQPVTRDIVSRLKQCANRTPQPSTLAPSTPRPETAKVAPPSMVNVLGNATIVEKSPRLEFISDGHQKEHRYLDHYDARRMIDGNPESIWATDAFEPHYLVLRLQRTSVISKLIVANRFSGHRGPDGGNNATKRLQFWLTDTALPDNWRLAGEFLLQGPTAVRTPAGGHFDQFVPDQRFDISPTKAKFVKIVFLESYWDPVVVQKWPALKNALGFSIGEIYALGTRE